MVLWCYKILLCYYIRDEDGPMVDEDNVVCTGHLKEGYNVGSEMV